MAIKMGRWKEKKIKPRLWSFTYTFLTNKPMKSGYVKAKQYAIKRTKDIYDLIMGGKIKPFKKRSVRKGYKQKNKYKQ